MTALPASARGALPWARLAIYAILAVFGAIYLVPALLVLMAAFRTSHEVAQHGLIAWPERLSLAPFVFAWTEACVSGTCEGIASNFFNSVKIAIPATLIATAIGAVNGYALSHWRFPGASIVFGAIVLGAFMPPQTTLLPWAWTIGRLHLFNSVYGLILIHAVQGLALTTLFARSFFAQVPADLLKAAQVDGAGFWRIFFRVMLPLSPPILIVMVIWQFTQVWNDFLFGVVFSTGSGQPVTAALQSMGQGSSAAAVLIASIPPLLIYFFGGRYFVRGLTMGAIR
jgi:glucose/mannose transport system permease protein